MRVSRPLLLLIAVTGLLILIVIGIVVFRPSLGPSIGAVSSDRLRQGGVILLNPLPWDQPAVTQRAAESIARRQAPGGPVLQSTLAEVIFTNPSTRPPRLCWVESMNASQVTSNGPPGSLQRQATFYLVFIDAQTGDFISGLAGG